MSDTLGDDGEREFWEQVARTDALVAATDSEPSEQPDATVTDFAGAEPVEYLILDELRAIHGKLAKFEASFGAMVKVMEAFATSPVASLFRPRR